MPVLLQYVFASVVLECTRIRDHVQAFCLSIFFPPTAWKICFPCLSLKYVLILFWYIFWCFYSALWWKISISNHSCMINVWSYVCNNFTFYCFHDFCLMSLAKLVQQIELSLLKNPRQVCQFYSQTCTVQTSVFYQWLSEMTEGERNPKWLNCLNIYWFEEMSVVFLYRL